MRVCFSSFHKYFTITLEFSFLLQTNNMVMTSPLSVFDWEAFTNQKPPSIACGDSCFHYQFSQLPLTLHNLRRHPRVLEFIPVDHFHWTCSTVAILVDGPVL